MFTEHALTASRPPGSVGARLIGAARSWTGDWPPTVEEACLVERNQPIFWEGDPATSCYRVATGAVRSYKLLGDGRRQIVAFHVVDEFFGIECGNEHRFSAEAVKDTSVVSFPRFSIETFALCSGQVARDVVSSALLNLDRAQRHSIVLGRKAAQEKVASFLLDMSDRAHSDSFELPMSRTDIGDYLGLTIETVSRTFTQFARAAVIQMSKSKREIVLRDRVILRKLHDGALSCPLGQ